MTEGLSRATLFAMEQHAAQHPTWTLAIKPDEYPSLHTFFDTISHDSGGGAGHPHHLVDPKWEPFLTQFDAALALLAEDAMSAFAIGGDDPVEGMFDLFAHGDARLIALNQMAEEWFNA